MPTPWFPWIPYNPYGEHQSPYSYEKVETRRRDDDRVVTVVVRDMRPETNVADLWWRPVGELKPPVRYSFPLVESERSVASTLGLKLSTLGYSLW